MSRKSDIHIEILRFARANPGFTLSQLKSKFPNEFDWLYREIQHNKIFQTDKDSFEEDARIFLSFDDRFKLLEHEELADARKSSNRAMTVAIVSVLLTLAGLIYQLLSVQKVEIVNPRQTIAVPANNNSLNADASEGDAS